MAGGPEAPETRRGGVAGLVVGAVVLAVVALGVAPRTVDTDTLGQFVIFLVCAGCAFALAVAAVRARRDR